LLAEGVTPEALGERLGVEVGVSGDRAVRLVEALEAVGPDPSRVRLVRVFSGGEQPKGATKGAEHHYLVDLQPATPAGKGAGRESGRGRRFDGGGGRRGEGERGGGGPGEGERGPREERGSLPRAGMGWVLTRDPSALREERRGRGRDDRRGRKPPVD